MASLLIIQRQIKIAIKRFKFEELERDVMPIFPEITWSRVKSKLVKDHKRLTVTNAATVIENAISGTGLSEKELYNRLAMLQVTDVSRHNMRKIWYTYELINLDKPVNYVGKRELEENITQEFHINSMPVNVKIVTYNDITFVHVEEKKKKRRNPIFVTPFYFALFLGCKYFFCSKKNISNNYIRTMANILGYSKSKKIKLTGRNVKSLMKILWTKQQGVLNAVDLNRSLKYEVSSPTVKNTGIDFSQNKQRENYAKQCFGENPPILESLVIHGPQESIQHHALASILPTNTIKMNWEFHSRNVAKFLTNLIERRIFVQPLPHYIENLMTLGKNELTLSLD